MSIISEGRFSDSPYVDTIAHGRTASDGSSLRPAECHWHMVLRRQKGNVQLLVVGPWAEAGVASWTEGAELLWIRFSLGTFMPRLPASNFLDAETILPGAASGSFWLNGSAWRFPDYDNAEAFVERLVRDEVLVRDPVVNDVLRDRPQELSSRTVRHRFLRATGLTQSRIRRVRRAQQATALLRQGRSILDTVHDVGYFDQPHLTRSLKRWIGRTPAQIASMSKSE
jgi:AraC-like DNA-binding protein